MVDLHTHILFGWDDGAKTIEDSLTMARIAAEDGIRTLAATPHFVYAGRRIPPDMVRERVAAINELVRQEGLDIRIVVGSEVQGIWDHFNLITHGQVVMLDDSRTVLFEPPFRQLPVQFADLLFQVRMAGFTPLLAHPERCEPFLADFDLFQRTVSEDIPLQITTTSLLGGNGERIEKVAWKMVRLNRPIVVASDAHGPEHRRPRLGAARAVLAEELGEEAADLMCRGNAAALLENGSPGIAALKRDEPKPEQTGLMGRLRRTFGARNNQ